MKADRKTATGRMRAAAAALVAGCALGAASASAADITLSYQAIVHATEVHDIPVEGLSGRAIGIAAFRGLAIFEDGRIANHWYAGHFDFHEQSGPYRRRGPVGIRGRLDGCARAMPGRPLAAKGGGITFTGRHSDVTGTGAYDGATGQRNLRGPPGRPLAERRDTYYPAAGPEA